jgi:phosphopantetheine adenylyltransferase
LDEKIAENQHERDKLDNKQLMVNALLASKDLAIKEQKARIENLETKLEELQKFIKEQKLDLTTS